MTAIAIARTGESTYRVTVTEGGSHSVHEVTVTPVRHGPLRSGPHGGAASAGVF